MGIITLMPDIEKIQYKYDTIQLITKDKIDIIIDFGLEDMDYDKYSKNNNRIIILKKELFLEISVSLYDKNLNYDYPITSITSTKSITNSSNYINYFLYTFISIFKEELDKMNKYTIDLINKDLSIDLYDIIFNFNEKYNAIKTANQEGIIYEKNINKYR